MTRTTKRRKLVVFALPEENCRKQLQALRTAGAVEITFVDAWLILNKAMSEAFEKLLRDKVAIPEVTVQVNL